MITDKRRIFWIALFLFVSLASAVFARDMKFEVILDRNKISLGSTASLNLNFYGTQHIVRPDLPDIHGFEWRYLGPSTRMSIRNGRVSTSITHMYVLIPLEVGKFSIPPLSVYYKGKIYKSNPIPIEVVRGPVSPQPQTMPDTTTYEDRIQGLEDRIFLTMKVDKNRAYINEIIPVTIKLYVNRLAIRDIQFPEFAHEGFSVDKFGEPRQYREVLNGINYDVIEFNTHVYGVRHGELALGPTELKCNLLMKEKRRRRPRSSLFDDDFFGSDPFDSFFGGYKKYPLNLKSIDIPITITDLPTEDVPGDFSGALGNYRLHLEANPREVKVGDPITLKMTITGEGNFNSVKSPSLNGGDDFKIYDPDVKQDMTGKVFEQIIIPKNTNVKEIPKVSFSFFDTESGKYKRITRGPISIKVNPLPEGEELKIFETAEGVARVVHKREILGRDIIYIKDLPGKLRPRGEFLCKNRLFAVVQFIPLLAIISVLIFQKRKERLQTDIRYARRLRALRKARKNLLRVRRLLDSKEPNKFFDAVFKTLQEYLGDKFHLSTAGITSNIVETLESYNVEDEILNKLKDCFDNCDRARYAPLSITKDEMGKTFKLLEEIIDKLERIRL